MQISQLCEVMWLAKNTVCETCQFPNHVHRLPPSITVPVPVVTYVLCRTCWTTESSFRYIRVPHRKLHLPGPALVVVFSISSTPSERWTATRRRHQTSQYSGSRFLVWIGPERDCIESVRGRDEGDFGWRITR